MAGILIFDEDRHIREWLSLELVHEGYDVVTASSCQQLMDKIETAGPDLIIFGISASGCDGLERLHQIRESHAALRVILWTVYDFSSFKNRAIAANCIVSKSYDLTELKSKIQSAFEADAPPVFYPDKFHSVHWGSDSMPLT